MSTGTRVCVRKRKTSSISGDVVKKLAGSGGIIGIIDSSGSSSSESLEAAPVLDRKPEG